MAHCSGGAAHTFPREPVSGRCDAVTRAGVSASWALEKLVPMGNTQLRVKHPRPRTWGSGPSCVDACVCPRICVCMWDLASAAASASEGAEDWSARSREEVALMNGLPVCSHPSIFSKTFHRTLLQTLDLHGTFPVRCLLIWRAHSDPVGRGAGHLELVSERQGQPCTVY